MCIISNWLPRGLQLILSYFALILWNFVFGSMCLGAISKKIGYWLHLYESSYILLLICLSKHKHFTRTSVKYALQVLIMISTSLASHNSSVTNLWCWNWGGGLCKRRFGWLVFYSRVPLKTCCTKKKLKLKHRHFKKLH